MVFLRSKLFVADSARVTNAEGGELCQEQVDGTRKSPRNQFEQRVKQQFEMVLI